MEINWLRLALNDIDEIAHYIARDNPSAANDLVKLIYDNIQLLSNHPHMGRPGRVPETRELYISGTPFIVPYRIIESDIQILRVLHTSRQWPEKL